MAWITERRCLWSTLRIRFSFKCFADMPIVKVNASTKKVSYWRSCVFPTMLSICSIWCKTNSKNLFSLFCYLSLSYKTISALNLAWAHSYLISSSWFSTQSPKSGLYFVSPINKGARVPSFVCNAFDTFSNERWIYSIIDKFWLISESVFRNFWAHIFPSNLDAVCSWMI